MLKRYVCMGLICALALSFAAVAAAQEVPQPVVRMGQSIELADDVWVNFIGTADIRFQYVHNRDFEDDIRDRVTSRDNTATSNHVGSRRHLVDRGQVRRRHAVPETHEISGVDGKPDDLGRQPHR